MSRSDYLWMCHRFSCNIFTFSCKNEGFSCKFERFSCKNQEFSCNSKMMECYLAGVTNSKGFWPSPKAVIGFCLVHS